MATQQPQFQLDPKSLQLVESKPRSLEIEDIPRPLRPLVRAVNTDRTLIAFCVTGIAVVPASVVGVLVEGLHAAVGLALWSPFALTVGIIASAISGVAIEESAQRKINAEHENSSKLAVEAHGSTPDNDFEGWLREHYNLSLNSKDRALSWTKEEDQKIELLTAEGALLEARLVNVGDGRFELRKSRVADTAESPYFTLKSELPSLSSSLTAQREKPLAITAGR